MDADNQRRAVILVPKRPHLQCARWDCRLLKESVYCCDSCQEMAINDAKATVTFLRPPFTSSPKEFSLFAGKIFNHLKAKIESGVPQFSPDLLITPPWESNMFQFDQFTPVYGYCHWLFISLNEIPETKHIKWIGKRSKVIGEVTHRAFKPFPSPESTQWELNQFSSPDLMDKAVYVMYSIEKAKDEETECFMKLYLDMEALERTVASFALACQDDDDKKKVLTSVSEEIHLQMETVIKSHIFPKVKLANEEGVHPEIESLERAVALFTLARQDIEEKLKSGDGEKSYSEMVASVSKEIHIQMENIKSVIKTYAEMKRRSRALSQGGGQVILVKR